MSGSGVSCPGCGSSNIVDDDLYSQAQMVCVDCGSVVSEGVLAHDPNGGSGTKASGYLVIVGTRFLVSVWRYGGQSSTSKLGPMLGHLEQLRLAHKHSNKQTNKHLDALLTGQNIKLLFVSGGQGT